jgi:hypothetical protein
MKTPTELQLRKIAIALTAVVALQLLWGGARLLLVSDPEPVLPAEASLQVEDIRFAATLGEEQPQDLVSRPVFWQGRQPYTAPAEGDTGEPEKRPRNSEINSVALQGVYAAGDKSGVIVSYKDERHRLQQDESVAGWTFSALNGTGAVFTYGDERQELLLEHALSVPAPKDKHKKSTKTEATDSKDPNNQDITGE